MILLLFCNIRREKTQLEQQIKVKVEDGCETYCKKAWYFKMARLKKKINDKSFLLNCFDKSSL